MTNRAGLSVFVIVAFSFAAKASGFLTENDGNNESDRNKRIVGGRIALKGSCPHVARISDKNSGSHLCGASIIGHEWILTAAHCFDQIMGLEREGESVMENLELVVGDYTVSCKEAKEQRSDIGQVFIHPAYDQITIDNDIALIHLSQRLEFNDAVQPVSISTTDAKPGRMCSVCGWGLTDRERTENSKSSNVLKQVSLPIVSMQECRKAHPDYAAILTSNMLCAGDVKGTRDSCRGDSGGPLVCKTTGDEYKQYGVVSFGPDKCAAVGFAGIYTRLSKYIGYIQSTTGLQVTDQGLEPYKISIKKA